MSDVLLNNVSATGEGEDFPVEKGFKKYTFQVDLSGTVTACTVDIKGRLSQAQTANNAVLGTYALTATDISNKFAVFHIIDRIVDFIKADITTLSGGGSATVLLKSY